MVKFFTEQDKINKIIIKNNQILTIDNPDWYISELVIDETANYLKGFVIGIRRVGDNDTNNFDIDFEPMNEEEDDDELYNWWY